MIKFFRHIRRTLINQNQMGKYFKYAIGEIILVVIGILIALQINNWNENRKVRINEKQNLTQLLEDYNTNKQQLKVYLNHYERTKKYTYTTLKYTGPKVKVPSTKAFDSVVGFNYPSIQLLYTTPNTIAGLDLDEISSNALKEQISTFPLAYANYEKAEKNIEKLTIEQRKIHQQYMSLISEEPGYSQNMFIQDSSGLLRDRQLQNITVDKLWNVKNAEAILTYLEKHNDSIISLLEIELEKLSD